MLHKTRSEWIKESTAPCRDTLQSWACWHQYDVKAEWVDESTAPSRDTLQSWICWHQNYVKSEWVIESTAPRRDRLKSWICWHHRLLRGGFSGHAPVVNMLASVLREVWIISVMQDLSRLLHLASKICKCVWSQCLFWTCAVAGLPLFGAMVYMYTLK